MEEVQQKAYLSPLSKILIGGVIVLVMAITLPMIDLLEFFFSIVLLPFIFLLALNMISEGTYEMIREATIGGFFDNLRKRIDQWRAKLKEDKEPVSMNTQQVL